MSRFGIVIAFGSALSLASTYRADTWRLVDGSSDELAPAVHFGSRNQTGPELQLTRAVAPITEVAYYREYQPDMLTCMCMQFSVPDEVASRWSAKNIQTKDGLRKGDCPSLYSDLVERRPEEALRWSVMATRSYTNDEGETTFHLVPVQSFADKLPATIFEAPFTVMSEASTWRCSEYHVPTCRASYLERYSHFSRSPCDRKVYHSDATRPQQFFLKTFRMQVLLKTFRNMDIPLDGGCISLASGYAPFLQDKPGDRKRVVEHGEMCACQNHRCEQVATVSPKLECRVTPDMLCELRCKAGVKCVNL